LAASSFCILGNRAYISLGLSPLYPFLSISPAPFSPSAFALAVEQRHALSPLSGDALGISSEFDSVLSIRSLQISSTSLFVLFVAFNPFNLFLLICLLCCVFSSVEMFRAELCSSRSSRFRCFRSTQLLLSRYRPVCWLHFLCLFWWLTISAEMFDGALDLLFSRSRPLFVDSISSFLGL